MLKTVKISGNLLLACQDNLNSLWLLFHHFQTFALSVKTIYSHDNDIIACSNLSTLENVLKSLRRQ